MDYIYFKIIFIIYIYDRIYLILLLNLIVCRLNHDYLENNNKVFFNNLFIIMMKNKIRLTALDIMALVTELK